MHKSLKKKNSEGGYIEERYNIAKRIDGNKIRIRREAWGVRESRRHRAHLNRNKHRRSSGGAVLSEEFGYLFFLSDFFKEGKMTA